MGCCCRKKEIEVNSFQTHIPAFWQYSCLSSYATSSFPHNLVLALLQAKKQAQLVQSHHHTNQKVRQSPIGWVSSIKCLREICFSD